MIAFIDCFIQSPANHCFNNFVEQTKIPATYHMPSQYGFSSLKNQKNITKIIILGSASHVYEKLTWQIELANFIDKSLHQNIPTLGLCFGHQLMADYYGCQVDYISKEKLTRKEIREITFEKDFFRFKEHEKITIPYAHAQIVTTLSDNYIRIARSKEFENEVIRHKELPLISFQGHPEASSLFLRDELSLKDEKQISSVISNGVNLLESFCLQDLN